MALNFSRGWLNRGMMIVAILSIAALLRIYRLSTQSLWADEGNSVALARRDFADIAQRTAFDIHPPLYYWLLKGWVSLFGDSEIGLRSLSVVLGVILVYLVGLLGARLFRPRVGMVAAFIAVFSPLQMYYAQEARMYMLLTVLSTLTVLVAWLIFEQYATKVVQEQAGDPRFNSDLPRQAEQRLAQSRLARLFPANLIWPSLLYIVTVTAGLYTHYAYPLILLVVNVAALNLFWQFRAKIRGSGTRDRRRRTEDTHDAATGVQASRLTHHHDPRPPTPNLPLLITNYHSFFLHWLLLQLIPLLLYLPWLPIAWRQITTWPSERQNTALFDLLGRVSTTLLFGLSWPDDLGLVTTIGLGLVLLTTAWIAFEQKTEFSRSQPPAFVICFPYYGLPLILTWLWFLLPVLLTIVVFSPAFLKFLLVASPPLTILIAIVIERLTSSSRDQKTRHRPPQARRRHATGHHRHEGVMPHASRPKLAYLASASLLAFLISASLLSLYHYHYNLTYARDNYRGIVEFIKAVGGPEDAVILTAEGQQDVFNYYYEQPPALAAPVHPLPRQRPLDETATRAELQRIAQDAEKIYAVYWASEQADPQGLIEGWLDAHLFKATDQWYGNVRLVSYAGSARRDQFETTAVDYRLGPHIWLTEVALTGPQTTPGDILQIGLTWQTKAPLSEDYTVFVQVLDQANHLVGQRDASPLTPTSAWLAGKPIADSHGVFIEPGTPPGPHRLIVGLYNSRSGQRLPVTAGKEGSHVGNFVELAVLEIVGPDRPMPLEAFTMQTRLAADMGSVTLLGYDLYKLGHRSNPDAPLYSGDPLQVVAYWRVNQATQGPADELSIQLVTSGGQPTPLAISRPLAGVAYPVSTWPVGQIVRAQYSFPLSDLAPGRYRLVFMLNDEEAMGQPFLVE